MADKRKICIIVEPREYELIVANAKSVDMSLAGYVKRVSLDRIVIHNNYDAIMEYTNLINRTSSEINSALNSLIDSRIVYPADLKHIRYLLKEMTDLQRKLLQRTEQDRNYYRKYIRKLHEEVD